LKALDDLGAVDEQIHTACKLVSVSLKYSQLRQQLNTPGIL